MPRVLIVDDDDSFREVMLFHLQEAGIEADPAADGVAGLAAFQPAQHTVVVTDMKMPRLDGLGLLRKIKEKSPETAVIVITAFGAVETAVDAMKAGAFDFIPKPCAKDHFILTVKRALEHQALQVRVHELEHVVATGERELVFQSAAMRAVVAVVDKVAPSNASVLLTGESGVGKELVARRLHRRSGRLHKPFIAVNCGAIPKELIESELFGHAKGAFTGATRDRKGKFELAHQGTLLLDEVGELPAEMQSKLLRVLGEQVIDVVGQEKPLAIDARIVAATNQDLAKAVAEGRFRQDLFYRLNVIAIDVPPLRRRPEDIPLLVENFLRRFSPDRPLSLAPEVQEAFFAYSWPGNVRELENVCRRLALLAEQDEITADLLPAWPTAAAEQPTATDLAGGRIQLPPEGINLADLEKNVIEEALRLNGYNQTKTAKFLGIARHILLYRLQKFGIALPGKTN